MKELDEAKAQLYKIQEEIRFIELDLVKKQITEQKIIQKIQSITNYLNHDLC